MEEKVSIVIPVYNSAKFLEQSIESVLNQTYSNIEVIAVNDGSTDDSEKILERFSDKITVISKRNEGLASALNAGIAKMSGKWFKWFSPDDIMYPGAIETLVGEANKQPDDTIIYSNWDIINEEGKKLRSFSETDYNNLNIFEFNVRLLDGQQINVNTTLIPALLLKKEMGFTAETSPVALDYELFLRLGLKHNCKFHLIPKSLIQYRIHAGQLSHKQIKKTLQYIEELKKNILKELDNSSSRQYISEIKKYRKSKSLPKKIMELGLQISQNFLPENINDRMITFYLNEIRRNR